MWDKLTATLTNVVYAGVGAAAIAAEKAGELGKVLVEKGEIAAEQGIKKKVPERRGVHGTGYKTLTV